MPSFFTRVVALACALALCACTSMQVVSDRTATPAQAAPVLTKTVHVNDQVRITTVDGTVHLLRVTAVSDTELAGVTEGSAVATSIPADQVARIERRELAPGKTTLLVGGVIGTTALVLYTVAIVALLALVAH